MLLLPNHTYAYSLPDIITGIHYGQYGELEYEPSSMFQCQHVSSRHCPVGICNANDIQGFWPWRVVGNLYHGGGVFIGDLISNVPDPSYIRISIYIKIGYLP